ncbi:hypothetical protein [Solibacillus sp. FSL K6-1523]|uniref:hypothetical protein n=1 Tax=Solibacillus sp. FSL K6-1523 TaxID=2921471 RepID=UPI0030F4BC51
MFQYEIRTKVAVNNPKTVDGVYEVQINEGAYHFYNVEDILFFSIPVAEVHSIELIN